MRSIVLFVMFIVFAGEAMATAIDDGRLGIAAMKRGDNPSAKYFLDRAISSGQLSSAHLELAYTKVAEVNMALGNRELAWDEINKALSLDPHDPEAVYVMMHIKAGTFRPLTRVIAASAGTAPTSNGAAPSTTNPDPSPPKRALPPKVQLKVHDLSGTASSKQPCSTDDCVATQDQIFNSREAIIANLCRAWDPAAHRWVKPGGMEINAICDVKLFKGGGGCFLQIDRAYCVVDAQ